MTWHGRLDIPPGWPAVSPIRWLPWNDWWTVSRNMYVMTLLTDGVLRDCDDLSHSGAKVETACAISVLPEKAT